MFALVMMIVLIFLYLKWKRSNLVKSVNMLNKLLYVEKNPEEYIKECDLILMKPQSQRDRAMNLIQKTTGLFYAGRFDEVEKILNKDVEKIPPNSQHIYYHNLLLSMMLNEKGDEAHHILSNVEEVLAPFMKNENSKMGIEFIFAVDDFYQNRGEKRKDFFKDIAENGRNDYRKALGSYFLGMIYKYENNLEQMKVYFDKAKALGKNCFVVHKIDELELQGENNE